MVSSYNHGRHTEGQVETVVQISSVSTRAWTKMARSTCTDLEHLTFLEVMKLYQNMFRCHRLVVAQATRPLTSACKGRTRELRGCAYVS